jgi:endogenous inhibitor of DNA gyrase (YacG/DUF329 family)
MKYLNASIISEYKRFTVTCENCGREIIKSNAITKINVSQSNPVSYYCTKKCKQEAMEL